MNDDDRGMTNISADRLLRISHITQKRIEALLDRILAEAMDITRCDGGTVLLREGEGLAYQQAVIHSRGIRLIRRGDEAILPPVPLASGHVCARAALERRRINLPDVYAEGDYDFTDLRRRDALDAYRTRSMLVVPMADEGGDCVGVMQLINARDAQGRPTPFDPGFEGAISALGALAAVSVKNNRLH